MKRKDIHISKSEQCRSVNNKRWLKDHHVSLEHHEQKHKGENKDIKGREP